MMTDETKPTNEPTTQAAASPVKKHNGFAGPKIAPEKPDASLPVVPAEQTRTEPTEPQ